VQTPQNLSVRILPHRTLVSHSGTVVHNGQFFFHEKWNDRVYAERPYTDNKNKRTLNKDDHILSEENADGNNAFLELELLGESLTDGILGYISAYSVYFYGFCMLIRLRHSNGRELFRLV
jgi:hypothetical protein